jgi:hypothetical protein
MSNPERHVLPVYAVVPRKEEQMHKKLNLPVEEGLITNCTLQKGIQVSFFLERKIFQNEFNVHTPQVSGQSQQHHF